MSLTQTLPWPPTSPAPAQANAPPAPSLEDVLHVLRAAGEATRLRILLLLSESELTVTDLARVLGQSQPRVSRHIKILLEAGLIERHREGSWTILRLGGVHGPISVIQGMLQNVAPDLPERRHDRAQLDLIKHERHERAQAFFAREAANWNTVRSLHVDETQVEAAIRDLVGPDKVKQLMDLGTGTGRILELLADRADRAIGFDVNFGMLAYARNKLDQPNMRHCQVRQGDMFQLPQYHGKSDLVVLHHVLHFLTDPAVAVREAAHLLAPGGRLLIVDFSPHTLEYLREQENHTRLGFSKAQMNRWLRDAGLRTLAHKTLPPDEADTGQYLTVSLSLSERLAATPIRNRPQS